MPVKLKVTRRVEMAPGVTNYELAVSDKSSEVKKPKIDKAFAKSFLERLTQETPRVAGFMRKNA
jgi:hypothetical protein